MRARAVELIVKHAMLVQHAVQNIGRDPARGEAGDLGRRGKSGGGHAKNFTDGRTHDAAVVRRFAGSERWHGNMPNVRIPWPGS